MLFGAHPFGDFRDGEDVQARVALGIFREDFGGVVGAAVVGDPDVPLARVVLGEDGVEGGPDAGRFVTGGDQDAHVGLGFHVGFPEAHVPQGAVEPHLQDYVEQSEYGQKADNQVCERRENHFSRKI